MEDQLVLLHSNRVAVVCLAPTHPIVRDRLRVDRVDFKINETLNRLENKVSAMTFTTEFMVLTHEIKLSSIFLSMLSLLESVQLI